mmetsp:Transcript_135279/g.342290  ORF Transcript_135279/g.342290 Transcript_135279/m.342290 type:complete len:365 (-) Transcript_135279:372-1466(-)
MSWVVVEHVSDLILHVLQLSLLLRPEFFVRLRRRLGAVLLVLCGLGYALLRARNLLRLFCVRDRHLLQVLCLDGFVVRRLCILLRLLLSKLSLLQRDRCLFRLGLGVILRLCCLVRLLLRVLRVLLGRLLRFLGGLGLVLCCINLIFSLLLRRLQSILRFRLCRIRVLCPFLSGIDLLLSLVFGLFGGLFLRLLSGLRPRLLLLGDRRSLLGLLLSRLCGVSLLLRILSPILCLFQRLQSGLCFVSRCLVGLVDAALRRRSDRVAAMERVVQRKGDFTRDAVVGVGPPDRYGKRIHVVVDEAHGLCLLGRRESSVRNRIVLSQAEIGGLELHLATVQSFDLQTRTEARHHAGLGDDEFVMAVVF